MVPQGKIIFVRNFIFGVEDSLVSTLGFLAGIAVAGIATRELVTSGIVLILVEAFSMGVGSFLSEESAEEVEEHREVPMKKPLDAAAIMFFSYIFAGLIPLGPYVIFPRDTAFWTSIGLSLFALWSLGFFRGKISAINPFKSGLRILVVGGCAMAIGALIGGLLGNR